MQPLPVLCCAVGMRKLLGIAFVVFLVWFFFIRPGSSEFGCESAAAVAHAGSDQCPPSIQGAASDAQWAQDRYDSIKDAKITSGVVYAEDGFEHDFTSGEDSDADEVNEILRYAGVSFPRRSEVHPSSSHVEAKAAARMRDNDVNYGVMVINNTRGVCGASSDTDAYGCAQVLPVILQPGARLVVWWPTASRMAQATYIGGDS